MNEKLQNGGYCIFDVVYNDVIFFYSSFHSYLWIVIASEFWMTYKYKRIHFQCSPTIQCSIWNPVWTMSNHVFRCNLFYIHRDYLRTIYTISMNSCLLELFSLCVSNTMNDFHHLTAPLSIWLLLSKVNITKVLVDQSGSLDRCFMNYKWSLFVDKTWIIEKIILGHW